jgi:hypothetical protein
MPGRVDALRLLHGAVVHPDDDVALGLFRGTHRQGPPALAQHDERAGGIEADTGDLLGRDSGLRQRLLHGIADGLPDLAARLLDDGAARMEQRDVTLGRRHHAPDEIEDAGSGAARAHIDANDVTHITHTARAACRAGSRVF